MDYSLKRLELRWIYLDRMRMHGRMKCTAVVGRVHSRRRLSGNSSPKFVRIYAIRLKCSLQLMANLG